MADNTELAVVLKLVADQFQSELKKSKGSLGDFTRELVGWKTAATAIGTTLFAITKATANEGEALLQLSQRLGMTTEKLSGLQYAGKLLNVENETLEKGLKNLAIRTAEAAAGAGEGVDFFRRLGISVKDANGAIKPMGQLFDEVVDKFAKMERGAVRTELAQKGFAKSGFEMLKMMEGGTAELARYHAEAEKLGVVWKDKDAQAANDFNDATDRLTSSLKGLRNEVGVAMIPPMLGFVETLTSIIQKTKGSLERVVERLRQSQEYVAIVRRHEDGPRPYGLLYVHGVRASEERREDAAREVLGRSSRRQRQAGRNVRASEAEEPRARGRAARG